jgi:hypothetical protein
VAATDSQFDLIEAETGPHHVGNRTRSTALLAWFLETVWRLEPEEASDAICDGGGDKGIDALHVDNDAREITVLQAKHRTAPHLTQGDNDLKALVGTAAYFESPEGVDALLASGPNQELRRLIERLEVRAKLEEGDYSIRLVFVTNALLDVCGTDYVAARTDQLPPLDVWSRERLSAIAARTSTLRVGVGEISVTTATEPLVVDLNGHVRMAIALVSAPDLVRLPGIDDLSIFELNVRLGLGRTRINKELAKTIQDPTEHELFSTYHNGMTLLTRTFHAEGAELRLDGVSVVNGCQSMLALFANKSSLSPSLQVLVRIVELGTEGELVDKITYRTNNQNPVNIRDQRSTDKVQRDLQAQLAETYGSELALAIRSGEPQPAVTVIENGFLAQLVMATYIGEPWNAIRKIKLFDHEYHRIFNRHLDAHRIVVLHLIDQMLVTNRSRLRAELNAAFSSVRFTLAYLVFRLIGLTPEGEAFLQNPVKILSGNREAVASVLAEITTETIESANYFVESKEVEAADAGETFDPKVIFKSRTGVTALERDTVSHGRRMVHRDAQFGFRLKP